MKQKYTHPSAGITPCVITAGTCYQLCQYRFMKKEEIKLNSASCIMTTKEDNLTGDTKHLNSNL